MPHGYVYIIGYYLVLSSLKGMYDTSQLIVVDMHIIIFHPNTTLHIFPK